MHFVILTITSSGVYYKSHNVTNSKIGENGLKKWIFCPSNPVTASFDIYHILKLWEADFRVVG